MSDYTPEWFETGLDGDQPRPKKAGKLFRVWMKAGTEGMFTFVDDVKHLEDGEEPERHPFQIDVPVLKDGKPQLLVGDDKKPILDKDGDKQMVMEEKTVNIPLPLKVTEHHLKDSEGKWGKVFYTCLNPYDKADKQCPLCQSGDEPYQIAVFTVIDHRAWKDNDGNEHRDQLKLYCVKTTTTTYALIKKRIKKQGSLRGVKVEITRTSGKATNVGDMMEFEEVVKLGDDIQPAPYLKIFAPLPKHKLAKFAKANADDAVDEGTDDSIPWG